MANMMDLSSCRGRASTIYESPVMRCHKWCNSSLMAGMSSGLFVEIIACVCGCHILGFLDDRFISTEYAEEMSGGMVFVNPRLI